MSVSPLTDGCREKDSNLRRHQPADLQSAPFGRSGIPALLSLAPIAQRTES